MGMTGAGMTAAVVAAVESAFPGMSAPEIAQLQTSMAAICGAIVTYVQSNAVVTVTSVTGVTTGGGTSGPGSGTVG